MSWSTNPDVFFFGPTGVLDRVKTFAGVLFLFLIGWYLILVIFDSIRSGELVLLQSDSAWYLAVVSGTVFISAWLGYSNGGLLVAGVVGLVPGVAFAIIGTVVDLLDLSNPDAPMRLFVLALFGFGVLLAVAGFIIGRTLQFATGT